MSTISEPHKIVVKVYTGDGKHRMVHYNPETAKVLAECYKRDGVYFAIANSHRDVIIRNEIK